MEKDYQIIDSKFEEFIYPYADVERLYTGTRYGEGPVYFGDRQYFVWSDIPNDRLLCWDERTGAVRVYRQPNNGNGLTNNGNGNTRDRQGRLITCEQGARRVIREEWDGKITILADKYEGKRINSPNDVVVKSDDTVWFTDPAYGIVDDYDGNVAESELGNDYVFRCDPQTGSLEVVADDLEKPNGLAFSPDEKILYISDTSGFGGEGAHHIKAYDVVDGKKLTNGRVVAVTDVGIPDGFRLDIEGFIWSSAGDGVHCFSPEGALLGKIRIPEVVSNVTFGGIKKNRLFMTGVTSLYSVFLCRRGLQWP